MPTGGLWIKTQLRRPQAPRPPATPRPDSNIRRAPNLLFPRHRHGPAPAHAERQGPSRRHVPAAHRAVLRLGLSPPRVHPATTAPTISRTERFSFQLWEFQTDWNFRRLRPPDRLSQIVFSVTPFCLVLGAFCGGRRRWRSAPQPRGPRKYRTTLPSQPSSPGPKQSDSAFAQRQIPF